MKATLIIFGSIIAIFAMIFLANEFEIFGVRFWGVRKACAQREVFEQSQSYVEGKRQELVKLHHEWIKADDESKKAIESTIRISFANFDSGKITDPDMNLFLHRIMNE